MIEIVSATRMTEAEFWQKAALGISLNRLAAGDRRLVARVAYENRIGLPELYNTCIRADDSEDILVFMHDDVWIDDYFFVDRVLEGLGTFDVIGVAGNRRRQANQPAWAFADDTFRWDEEEYLSGALAHGEHPFGDVLFFGAVPAACELLDGVFLAARKGVLREHGVLFDPRFDFHFYDLDFCRSARSKGLRLGTWPICLTHQSGGAFNSPAWHEKLRLYREKWGA
jgi:GT2 family glycosyltransferase